MAAWVSILDLVFDVFAGLSHLSWGRSRKYDFFLVKCSTNWIHFDCAAELFSKQELCQMIGWIVQDCCDCMAVKPFKGMGIGDILSNSTLSDCQDSRYPNVSWLLLSFLTYSQYNPNLSLNLRNCPCSGDVLQSTFAASHEPAVLAHACLPALHPGAVLASTGKIVLGSSGGGRVAERGRWGLGGEGIGGASLCCILTLAWSETWLPEFLPSK